MPTFEDADSRARCRFCDTPIFQHLESGEWIEWWSASERCGKSPMGIGHMPPNEVLDNRRDQEVADLDRLFSLEAS